MERRKPTSRPNPEPGVGTYLRDGTAVMLWAFLCLSTVLFLVYASLAVTFPYPLDYGEAPLIDQAVRLSEGRSIYRRDLSLPPYTVSNYPPVYIVALVPLVLAFGPAFAAGRILSLACGLLSAFLVGVLVETHTHQRDTARLASLLFLAFPYVVQWTPLLRVDMLALALSLAALVVLSRWRGQPAAWLVSAGLLVAAVYTRQSYGLAAPLAAFVWLWRTENPRSALRLAAVAAGAGLGLLGLLTAATEGGFAFHILTANANAFELPVLLDWARAFLVTAPLLVLLCGILMTFGVGRAPMATLTLPYLIGATASAATIGKVGSNVNYLLELCVAVVLVAASTVAWARSPAPTGVESSTDRTGRRPWLVGSLQIALAVQIGMLCHATLTDPVIALKWRLKARTSLDRLDLEVRMAEGPVLADEYMGLLTSHGRELYLQPFEMTQLARAGYWDETPLVRAIEAQTFPLILVHHFAGAPIYKSRWTEAMLNAVTSTYIAADLAADTIVFHPRGPGEIAPSPASICPAGVWPAPTESAFGVWWYTKELWFLGEGLEGTVPVLAVADGLLVRPVGWDDAVAISHDDPLKPGARVWTFYGDMTDIPPSLAPGTAGVGVTQGQILGYQSRRSASGPIWPHLRFAIVPALEDGGFPAGLVGMAEEGAAPLSFEFARTGIHDPSPYLGTLRSQVSGSFVWLPPRCAPGTAP